MRSPREFLSGEFLKVKYTCRLSTEYPPELRKVPGPIESTAQDSGPITILPKQPSVNRMLEIAINYSQWKSSSTVLCKSNANVFRRNSRLFLAFRRKNIEFSMEANFQRKVMIIRDSYRFQLREFSNVNSFGTKIYFEFSSENSQCSINDLEHLSAISLFVFPAQTFPRIFWTINCPVRISRDDYFLMSFHSVSFTRKLVSIYTTGLYKTDLYCFKGSFYCLLHVESIAALTPLFFGAHVC